MFYFICLLSVLSLLCPHICTKETKLITQHYLIKEPYFWCVFRWQHTQISSHDSINKLKTLFHMSFATNFYWYATIESNLLQAFGDLLPSIMHSLHGAIRMPDLFLKIWLSLCSLFIQHGCLLFFKFTLASGLFAHGVFARAWVLAWAL